MRATDGKSEDCFYCQLKSTDRVAEVNYSTQFGHFDWHGESWQPMMLAASFRGEVSGYRERFFTRRLDLMRPQES